MLLRYASIVSFVSLLVAFSATLMVGWAYTQSMPLPRDQQQLLFQYAAALAIIAWPIWLIHWYLLLQEWNWESRLAQNYLIFFTVVGLVGSVVVGVQLLVVVMKVASGESFESHEAFLIGAGWSVGWSLAVWLYHGASWLRHRRTRRFKEASEVRGTA